MKTHTGSCHCNAVRFEADTNLENVISCNCSHCSRKGLLLSFVPAESFRLLKGAEDLFEYRFNTKKIAHLFCKNCGVQPFGRGKNKEGEETVAVNVRCLEGVDPDAISATKFDGKNY